MKKGRLEAFSDGVVAIIITIMVLEFKVPGEHHDNIKDLVPLLPVIFGYVLSFVYVGIYWNNHHHMFYLVESISGAALWGNLNLLFWLSLIPFVTEWMDSNHFTKWPVVIYGIVLIMNATSYSILARILINHSGKNSALAQAMGKDWKGKVSLAIYAVAIALSFVNSYIGFGLYALVACIWFIPDPRIEKKVNPAPPKPPPIQTSTLE
jgi:uncharacterized membrane protein